MKKTIQQNIGWMGIIIILVGLSLTGCAPTPPSVDAEAESPVKVEHLEGKIPTRLTLTEEAAKRIDLQTAEARDVQVNDTQLTSVPYGAIIYDMDGNTWLYTSAEELTFERTSVTVDHIDGDLAFLSIGPPAGTKVAARGVAELYGAETEFEEE